MSAAHLFPVGVFTMILAAAPARAIEQPPSEIEQHVSRAIAFAYLHKPEDLEREYAYFKGMDDFLQEQRQPATGVSDNILDLLLSALSDRDRGVTRELKERAGTRMHERVARADSLLLTDRYNRFAFIFNTFVRPLSLISVGYYPALIDAGLATALNANRLTDLSVEEKKALALYKEFLDRYPESDKAELLHQRVTALDRKRITACHDREMQLGGERLAKDEFWAAQQHFKNALAFVPSSPKASAALARTRDMEQQEQARRLKALEPAEALQGLPFEPEEREYRELLYGTAAGSPEAMIEAAEKFISRHPRSSHVPYARYAIAVAHDMKGAHEEAKKLMRRIAADHPRAHIGRRAAAYLADSGYDPKLALAHSRRQHTTETAKYVTLGPDFVKSNVILGPSRIITQGLQAFQTLGTFNVLALLIRGVNTVMSNPVSDQEIIDAGVIYLRRYPDSPAAPDVHLTLAKAYAKRQNPAKAVYHYAASGKIPEKKLSALRESAAKQYLDFASATESREEKIRCYETILDEYAPTRSAAKALEELAVLERTAKPIFEIDKKTLAANPVVFTLTDLHIGPHLLDDDPVNGELAPKGLYSVTRGKIILVYVEEKGEREETIEIPNTVYSGLRAFAEETEYRTAMRGGGKRVTAKFPVELRGTVGDAGVFVYPRLKVKEYDEKDQYLYR